MSVWYDVKVRGILGSGQRDVQEIPLQALNSQGQALAMLTALAVGEYEGTRGVTACCRLTRQHSGFCVQHFLTSASGHAAHPTGPHSGVRESGPTDGDHSDEDARQLQGLLSSLFGT